MDHNTDQDDSPKSTVVPIDDDALEAVTGGNGKGGTEDRGEPSYSYNRTIYFQSTIYR